MTNDNPWPHRLSTLNSRPSSTGECRIRTCEGISHQIYSLTRLTASVTPRKAPNNSCRAATAGRRLICGFTKQSIAITTTRNAALGAMRRESPNTGRSAATGHGHSPLPIPNPPGTRRTIHVDELAEGLEPTTC